MNAQPKDLLTAREVADRLNVSLRTVWRWAGNQVLPAPFRMGRIVRWKTRDIDRFIEQQLPSSGGPGQRPPGNRE
ncbi:MAG: helix-turn-helix domain-containing protein [Planctomycetes bacterium]|nr:helix-turn-helix domain-containing protein [Planctomycetota bacterium]